MLTGKKIKLSCVMLARNLISQGYPFVEAILSVIPYCEEMIICEGYSEDGTYEILRKLERVYDDRIIIKREKWVGKKDMGEVFSQLLNREIEESSGDYILKLDPDHVFDRDTLEDLIFSVRNYPKMNIFLLPYIYFVGNWIIKPEFWATTLVKKMDGIRLVKDSGGFSYTPIGTLKMMLKKLKDPSRSLKSTQYVYTPIPVYHYYALFPGNYIKKIEEHKKFYKKHDWSPYDRVIEKLKTIKDWDEFWRIVAKEIVEKTWDWCGNKKVVKYTGHIPQHPQIRPLLGQWEYKVREELINSKISIKSKEG